MGRGARCPSQEPHPRLSALRASALRASGFGRSFVPVPVRGKISPLPPKNGLTPLHWERTERAPDSEFIAGTVRDKIGCYSIRLHHMRLTRARRDINGNSVIDRPSDRLLIVARHDAGGPESPPFPWRPYHGGLASNHSVAD